jgi:CheY-like chemotaxis protein
LTDLVNQLFDFITGEGLQDLRGADSPVDEVTDALHARHNYFADLEDAARSARRDLGLHKAGILESLSSALAERHGITVVLDSDETAVGPADGLNGERQCFTISEALPASSAVFRVARQLGVSTLGPLLEDRLAEARLSTEAARDMYRRALASYFAGALLMPYDEFLEAACGLRHDIELLSRRFGGGCAVSLSAGRHRRQYLEKIQRFRPAHSPIWWNLPALECAWGLHEARAHRPAAGTPARRHGLLLHRENRDQRVRSVFRIATRICRRHGPGESRSRRAGRRSLPAMRTTRLPAARLSVVRSTFRRRIGGAARMTRSVLVVEDEPHIVDSLSFLMKQAGFSVQVARDGDAALRVMESRLPDLVLLDVMLPRRDGYDVCRAIRSNTAWDGVKIIMLTAKGRELDRRKGLELGADDYVTKPFSTREIVERALKLLEAEEE